MSVRGVHTYASHDSSVTGWSTFFSNQTETDSATDLPKNDKEEKIQIDITQLYVHYLLEAKNSEDTLLPSDKVRKAIVRKSDAHDREIVKLAERCIFLRVNTLAAILQLFYDAYSNELAKTWCLRDREATVSPVVGLEKEMIQLFYSVLEETLRFYIGIECTVNEAQLFYGIKWITRLVNGNPIELKEEIDQFQDFNHALKYLFKFAEKTDNIDILQKKSREFKNIFKNKVLPNDIVLTIDLVARQAISMCIAVLDSCLQFRYMAKLFYDLPYHGINPLTSIPFDFGNESMEEKKQKNEPNAQMENQSNFYEFLSNHSNREMWSFFKPLFQKRIIKQINFLGKKIDLPVGYSKKEVISNEGYISVYA